MAKALLGKIIRRKINHHWLAARIIETEAYYMDEKGSHSSLGYTEKRSAMFMVPGTIYMYFARGRDSLNVSCYGEGNAVLIKSGYPYIDKMSPSETIKMMQQLFSKDKIRSIGKLCNGQTLLCCALSLHVREWDKAQFDDTLFFIDDVGYCPEKVIQARRIGIPKGRDEDLLYRFIDFDYTKNCTSNPLSKRTWREGVDYLILNDKRTLNE